MKFLPIRFSVLLVLGFCLSSLCWLTACSVLQGSATGNDSAPLRVAYSVWPGYFPMAIAQKEGLFVKRGVAVEVVFDGSDTAPEKLVSDLAAGKLDGAFMSLGEAFNVTNSNPNVRIVAVVDRSDGGDTIVAQSAIGKIEDLKGKKLGVKLGGFSELFANEMLRMHGLTPNDVMLVRVPAGEVPDRILDGSIQAGHTWEPYLSQVVPSQAKVLFTSRETPGLIPDVIVFSESVVRDRPQEIQAFLQTWFEAVERWKANPDEGSAVIAKTLNLDPKTVSLEGIQLLGMAENLTTFQPGADSQSIVYTAQLYMNAFAQMGSLKRPIQLDKFLEPRFVKALANQMPSE